MDMETDSEDEEDGQITKYEEEEEKDRKRFAKIEPQDDEPITLEDLKRCRLTRTMLAKYCMAPWFEDFVKGRSYHYLSYGIGAHLCKRSVGTISHWSGGRASHLSNM